MPSFDYSARRPTGQMESGTLVATSRREVLQLLSAQSLSPVQLQESTRSASISQRLTGGRSLKVSRAAVGTMFDQLSHLLEAGVPLLKSLEILSDQSADPTQQEQLQAISQQVASGRTLADALKAHPDTFNDLIISLVHAGEEGGFLEESLTRIARLTQRQEELRSRVMGALTYPLFLVVVGTVVVTGMLTYFVPKFAPLFDRLRQRGRSGTRPATAGSDPDRAR